MAADRTGQDRTDQHGIDPSEQIPEADLLEQQISLDAEPLTGDDHDLVDRGAGAASADLVDEADRWEQQRPVPSADDDYPHDAVEVG